MRNIFDQYTGPENRVTHALASVLNEDRTLLKRFLRWLDVDAPASASTLKVVEQRIPGQPEPDENKDVRLGLPDLWIYDEVSGWSLLVESKISSPVRDEQVRRHLRTAERRGFTDLTILVLAPALRFSKRQNGDRVLYRAWTEVYAWARRNRERDWATRLSRYMEIAESRMVATEYLTAGTMTMFDGIPFDENEPYAYLEAKRLMRLMTDELRKRSDLRALGMDPEGPGRGAIKGRGMPSIWDFIPLQAARAEDNTKKFPHLTLAMDDRELSVVVTLPRQARAGIWNRLAKCEHDAFVSLTRNVAKRLARVTDEFAQATPRILLLQRHYPTQSSPPIRDGLMEFDLRTSYPERDGIRGVKPQPVWAMATHEMIRNRKGTNLQVGIGAFFPYGDPKLQSRKVLDAIARSWIACEPWLAFLVRARSVADRDDRLRKP